MPTVTSFDLSPDDVLVIKVSVGLMPPPRVKEYLIEVKSNIQEMFGTSQKIIMLPSRGEQTDTEIVIIKRR